MKYNLFGRELALGVVILFLIAAFGANNVPGDSKNIENEQIKEIIEIQNDNTLEVSEFINVFMVRRFLKVKVQKRVLRNFFNQMLIYLALKHQIWVINIFNLLCIFLKLANTSLQVSTMFNTKMESVSSNHDLYYL
jgi:hypothetical protein